jgi:hypothetical protein
MIQQNPVPESNPTDDSGTSISPNFTYSELQWKETNSTEFHRGSRGGNRRAGFRLLAWSWAAAVIDSLVVLGFLCLLIAGLALYFGPPAIATFETSRLEAKVGSIALLVAMYMILLRSFLGFSIGEWACGLRLGFLAQRLDKLYALKVVARTLLIFATGVVVLPLCSLLLGRDLAGELLRLPLIEKI